MNNPLTTVFTARRNPLSRRLMLAVWILLALLPIGLFGVDLIIDYSEMLVPCQGVPGVFADCNFGAITTAEASVLTSWGLTMRAYAVTVIGGAIFAFLVYLALAGLILWRQGSSWLGLTVSLALIIIPFVMYSGSRDFGAINPDLFWPGVVASILGTAVMLVFLYLVPNGRFSPRWAYIPLIFTLLFDIILTLEVNGVVSLSAPAFSLVNIALIALILFGGGLQVYRYVRDSNAVERQQTKWIIFALVIFVLAIMAWVLVFGGALNIPAGRSRLLANLGGTIFTDYIALPLLPVAIAIAILRYKLWDIDLIINKTLVYGLLSGLLAFVYFGLVLLFQRVFDLVSSQQSPVVIVISTLVIAALFVPLRQRVQTFIDRRFFRKKYDAQQVLAQFSLTARDETNLDALQAELLRVVEETIQPEQITFWLKSVNARND